MRHLGLTLVLSTCAVVSGCEDSPPAASPRNAVEAFKQGQANTMTPNGRILVETTKETSPGSLQYQTEDGRSWKVNAIRNGSGGYSYGTPSESR